MKRLVFVAFTVASVLIITSCSDNSTQSGVVSNYSKSQAETPQRMTSSRGSGNYSRSTWCDSISEETGLTYVNTKFNKLLWKCDSGEFYYSYSNRGESITTLKQWASLVCSDTHGSTATIIDSNEQQCSSGSGAYNEAAVGYVNKYGDLVAVYNASTSGQSKSLWGKNHYCNHGRVEGRTYSGLSSTSCGSTTTTSTSTTSNSTFEGYVNKYNDLWWAWLWSPVDSKGAWGKSHYCNSGRYEGRTYPGLSSASCGSTTTTTTTTSTSTSSSSSGPVVER